jgi:hypothetical protein
MIGLPAASYPNLAFGPDAPNGVEVSVHRRANSDVRVRLRVVRAGVAPGDPDQRRLPGGLRGRGGPCGSDSRVAPRAEAPVVLECRVRLHRAAATLG